MTPSIMREHLFDDILFGKEAREEHKIFTSVLKRVVEQVVDVQDLLTETLANGEAKCHFLDRLCRQDKLSQADREELDALDASTLAERAISGWYEEKDHGSDYSFRFPPLPNLLFMRDPGSVIGSGVSINHMSTPAREREPLIMDCIFRFHPDYKVEGQEKIWFDMIPSNTKGLVNTNHCMEGGDILVLSKDILAVGISERTTHSAVIMLAEKLQKQCCFKHLFAVLMPRERAVMHLDTIFTQIDPEHCLVFPPFFKRERERMLSVVRMDLQGKQIHSVLKDNFLDALGEVGHHLKPISCGGKKRIDQDREQWTDGANAFCLAPGVIMGYDRNEKTAKELDHHNYNVVSGSQVLKENIDLMDGKRYLVTIKANELSRARGGPRCMTMPLNRDG